MAGFARRDQNSSIGATTTLRKPEGPGQRPSLHARTGSFAGKTRGVGRKESRDANSSPRVTRIQPRSPQGHWVSHENDLQVIHPDGNKYRPRQPKTSALGIHRKDSGHVSRVYNGKKGEQTTFGKSQSLVYGRGNTRFGGTGTRGRKLS